MTESRAFVRWKIAGIVCCAIAISYFDRQTLPVAISAIQRDIPMSNSGYSNLQSAFLIAYAMMYAGGGRLIDLVGARAGFAMVMIWWSLACAGHGLARGFGLLAACRFLLGMGEGGAFPAATKVVSAWFPPIERSTAMGIINAGTAAGAVLAPPAIAAIIVGLNWRWVFFLAGLIGLLWSAWWLLAYREHPAAEQAAEDKASRWRQLFSHREVWGLVSAKFLSDAAWYFYLFWLPKYLYDARSFDVKQVGYYAWIPYAASGVGCLAGGWFSSWLLRQNRSLTYSRRMALGLSAAVMPAVVLITQVPVEMAIVIFSIAFFGQQSWSTLVMTLPADLFPNARVGSVAGLVGFGGAIGGLVFGQAAGFLLDHGYGYGTVFAFVGSFHVIAFGVLLLTVPRVERLTLAKSLEATIEATL
jgi:ACS family hexuronate transporter-like MFS transporter